MNTRTRSLLNSLYKREISEEDFIKSYSSDNSITVESFLKRLNNALDQKDTELLEEALALIFVLQLQSFSFCSVLCRLIKESWHYEHEDIARLLQDLANPETVDCLFEAAQMNFEYLAYDDTYQFGRKCIKALAAINNDNAFEKLKKLSLNENLKIAEYAIREL